MTPDRLAELRSKVHHGFNLLASEARIARDSFVPLHFQIESLPKKCGSLRNVLIGTEYSNHPRRHGTRSRLDAEAKTMNT